MALDPEAIEMTYSATKLAVEQDNDMVLELIFGAIWEHGHACGKAGQPVTASPWMRLPDDLTDWDADDA